MNQEKNTIINVRVNKKIKCVVLLIKIFFIIILHALTTAITYKVHKTHII